MTDFEKLGVFYLGRAYDLAARQAKQHLILYDSKDLVTHAVCVGMTGSGKTGLCIGLLEEAAIDGIPALIVDPKGDLGNLLLTFPELRPEDFRPWINEDDARKKGLTPETFAAQQAELWKKGLASWGQDASRIRRLREAVDFAIYTPGSSAGLPVSILQSFAAPGAAVRQDSDALRERIATTATSLLGLLGIAADPIKSREHILIATLLQHYWQQGVNLELATLIHAIQTPPVGKIGVFDLEAFYPAKERLELAMALNNLLASPGFQAWLEGEALDIQSLLYSPAGKPRHAIFSIAHLSDAERMFFVSLLLNQTLGWMRAQAGTTSLRAIFYMDEIFGYLPPVANPPSKAPLLTLLKQARAFGLGVVLATQNPVDLDYKGLSNIGTWFLGRLQTERDKARVLEGLEGAASGGTFDRNLMEQTLAGLGNRIFLMHNVHDDKPEVFETRWVMSYLAGPLTRSQIKTLMEARRRPPAAVPAAPVATAAPVTSAGRPILPGTIPQVFLPVRREAPANSRLLYQPFLFGLAQVQFSDAKKGVDVMQTLSRLVPITDEVLAVKWQQAVEAGVTEAELRREAEAGAGFAGLPAAAAQAANYSKWQKEFVAELQRSCVLELFKSARSKEISQPGESERDFRVRLSQLSRQDRDAEMEKLRRKYAPRLAALEEKIRRAEERVAREQAQARSQQINTVLDVGATILGAFMGRKTLSRTTVQRAGAAMRSVSRASREAQDVKSAQETLDLLQQQVADLNAEFDAEVAALGAGAAHTETLETLAIRPKKTGISVRLLALAWAPQWAGEDGTMTPAW
ncbi:MAG: ATP-binding protein [candidate division KSB1 bacterium]|nr:ATP-binding protein [candidate division KSB1 bacterium]MDZ7275686.1 ATP-binding protein [candidate division KSB1 bacterium]MDZ7284623.1 ATP-binding protein [candidate division KSB1 bacterium]MDZ7297958.1 ATP-binding protein [candidate division KSB1 bacterium]MDZ7309635.1 ATP-binding protein [candidate division KSB1 bacterium]